jgi:alanine dehydrogenase
MAVQVGAHYLQKENGGKEYFRGPGGPAGGGHPGGDRQQCRASPSVWGTSRYSTSTRPADFDDHYGNRIHTAASNSQNIEDEARAPTC